MHVIIGIPVVFATLLAEICFWRATRNDPSWKGYAGFSLTIFFVTLVSGLTTVAFVNSDIRGILERFSSGSFLLWIEVVALRLFKVSARGKVQVNS